MSADFLLRAAVRLREAAAKAASGPWTADGPGGFDWLVSDANGDCLAEAAENEQGIADAAWIALMSPAVAEPLAAWLEQAAGKVELNSYRAPRHRYDPAAALAVARAVLGEVSE